MTEILINLSCSYQDIGCTSWSLKKLIIHSGRTCKIGRNEGQWHLILFFSGPVPTFPHFDSQLHLTLTFAPWLFIVLPCISVYLLSDKYQLFTCLPTHPKQWAGNWTCWRNWKSGIKMFSQFSYSLLVGVVTMSLSCYSKPCWSSVCHL